MPREERVQSDSKLPNFVAVPKKITIIPLAEAKKAAAISGLALSDNLDILPALLAEVSPSIFCLECLRIQLE